MKKKFIVVTGGARSGKSAFSEAESKKLGTDLIYVATMEPLDAEMKSRIKKHKDRRGSEWKTIEEPLNVATVIKKNDKAGKVFLVDCLTLFLSNHLLKGKNEESLKKITEELAGICASCKASVVVVTNETGMGLVPENQMGREFRDAQGKANQIMAKFADEVYFMVSGLPLKIK